MSETRVFETTQSPIAFHAVAIVEVELISTGFAETKTHVLTVEREPRHIVRDRRISFGDFDGDRIETAFDPAINDAQAVFEFEIVYPFLHRLELTHLLPTVTFSPSNRGRLITGAVTDEGRVRLRGIQSEIRDPELTRYIGVLLSMVE